MTAAVPAAVVTVNRVHTGKPYQHDQQGNEGPRSSEGSDGVTQVRDEEASRHEQCDGRSDRQEGTPYAAFTW